jgi:hypothetical protein
MKGGEGERLLNVAYFIDGTGEVIGKYVKKNLWYVLVSFSCCVVLCAPVLCFVYRF